MTDTVIKLTEKACELCEKELSGSELFDYIENGTDSEKQICILKISHLESQKEADVLLFHLTNQHGTVREAAAEKINELMKKTPDFFQNDFAREKFLLAVNDVNPNICRLVIDILPLLCPEQKEKFLNSLYDLTLKVAKEAESLNVRNRSHIYTKKIFNLYWCLEAIAETSNGVCEKLSEIIRRNYKSEEYTVREKVAKIIKKLNVSEFDDILNILKTDENFYVRFQIEQSL